MALRITREDLELQKIGFDPDGSEILNYKDEPFTGMIEEYKDGILIGETEYFNGYKGESKINLIVGNEIAGKKIVAIRQGTNGKIALIGAQFPEHIELVMNELRIKGKEVEVFTPLDQDREKFSIEGKIYRWDDIVLDFKTNASYLRNEIGWVNQEYLSDTLMFKANKIWAKKLVSDGYIVLDMGYPQPVQGI